jgi:hypothetical protein
MNEKKYNELRQGGNMKINIAEIAAELRTQGFNVLDIDSEELTNAVIEILFSEGLFDELSNEMERQESDSRSVETELDYLEKIGEV